MNGYPEPRPLLVICGPTASGKTAVAVEAAKLCNGEIVSCDSMQIYRGMRIGTAVPTPDEMQGIAHHMLECVEPGTVFSASDYRDTAKPILINIASRGKLPILCGGTGLYIDSLTRPMRMAVKSDSSLRAELKAMGETAQGRAELYRELQRVDPETAAKVHPNDVLRVSRAMEVYRLTGKPISAWRSEDTEQPADFTGFLYALDWPREALYARIDARARSMFENGLIRETEDLLKRGIPLDTTCMQAIGYKETVLYLLGRLTKNEAADLICRNTRHYAKRQNTWFRRDERVRWVAAEERSAREIAAEILKDYQKRLDEQKGKD